MSRNNLQRASAWAKPAKVEPQRAADKNPQVQWCMDQKARILNSHSSPVQTKVSNKECDGCFLFFKSCMFSNAQRKRHDGATYCRCCQADMDIGTDISIFEIHKHEHCNQEGKCAGKVENSRNAAKKNESGDNEKHYVVEW